MNPLGNYKVLPVKNKDVIVTSSGQELGSAYTETPAADTTKVVIAEINKETGKEMAIVSTQVQIKTSQG